MAERDKTFETVRRAAEVFPDLEPGTMYGSPALKLCGRLVACLAVHKSAEPGTLVVRTSFEERAALLAEEPGTYYLTSHYTNHPVVLVRLSRIAGDQLRDLLGSARRHVLEHEARKRSRVAQSRQSRRRS